MQLCLSRKKFESYGEEHEKTLLAASNYAESLRLLKRSEEAKVLLCKIMPVARRVLGESHELMLSMRWNYARALYQNDDATLGDLCEAVTTLEESERTARRGFGRAHPLTVDIASCLLDVYKILRARETPSPGVA